MKNTMTFQIEPELQHIHAAREKSGRFFKSHGFSNNSVQVPLMILNGLIKSSIKICELGPADSQITVSLQVGENEFTIIVSNSVNEACDHRLMELDRVIQFIRGYQDPFEPYVKQRRNQIFNGQDDDIDRLNLATIAYEGKALLDFFVNEENILNLTAVGAMNCGDN